MKNLMSFLMIVLMVGCTKSPTKPDIIDDPVDNPIFFEPFVAQADIQLVRMGNGQDLAKIAVGEDISFGEIMATESISFIITNTGNVNLFNIALSANDLIVFPGNVGVLELPEGGLTTSPIVSITAEHVLPRSGVGSLLNMEVGEFTDTLQLSYQYKIIPFLHAVINETQIVALMDSITAINDSTSDTTWAWIYGDTLLTAEMEKDTVTNQLEYSVGGTKMGAIIDVEFSGQPIQDYNVTKEFDLHKPNSPWTDWPLTSFWPFSPSELSTSEIINNGNVPVQVKVVSWDHNITLIDTITHPGDILVTSRLLRNNREPDTGNMIMVGDVVNQPYILKVAGDISTNGRFGLIFWE